jgi:tetratricopeptide (TPR) repeat protein
MTWRLNGRLLACALGGTLVLAGAVHLLHAYQARRGARELLPLADAALARGDAAGAARFLGRYLELAPEDAGARVRCADLLARLPSSPDRGRARELYAEVLRHDPGRADVRRRLLRLDLDLGRFADVRDDLAQLLPAAPDDPELELAEGRCREAFGEDDSAAAWCARAIEHDPHRTDAYVRLARLQRLSLHRPAEADRTIDRLVTANPESFRAYLGRGQYRADSGAADAAARDLARAEELAPREPDVLRAAGELALKRHDYAGARRRLERCRQIDPRNLYLFEDLATLEAWTGHRPVAVAYLRQGLEVFPDQPDLLLLLADLLLQEYDVTGAGAVVNRLGQAGCPEEQVEYFQARLLLAQGRWAEAARLLDWLRQRAPASDLLDQAELALGQCYEQLDDPERELATFRRAAERSPRSPALRLALAGVLASQGRTDEAVSAAFEAVALPGAPAEGWALLGRLLLRRNRALPPGRRNWPEVERMLERAGQAAPGSAEVALLRAEAALAQGHAAEARAALAGDADGPEVAAARADLAALAGRWDDALRALDEAEGRYGDRVELRLARAQTWAQRGTAEAPARLAEAARGWERLPFADQVRLLRGLGEVYAAAGDSRAAARTWALLAPLQPCDLRLRLRLFDQAVREGDEAAAGHWREDMRRIEGEDGPHWCYAEAARLVGRARHGDRGGLAEARRLLDEAGARRRTWPRVPLLLARCDELEGKPRDAAADYLRAVELGERDPDVLRRLEELLTEQGRAAEARRLLGRLTP